MDTSGEEVPLTQNILLQNFPNPFNPTTTISFTLVEAADVSLTVYNIKGQEVEKFAVTNYDSGKNEIIWNAEKFSSGVYFYKLNINGKTIDTKKMLLMK